MNKQAGKTAWEQRSTGKMSFLEKWFYDNVILKYNLLDKYDIISEYSEYPYFIDFAFINIKLAVEMDGKQHFHNNRRIEHDRKKDVHLISKGWKVFRIAYNELNKEKISDLLLIISNINNYTPKVLEERLISYTESKKNSERRAPTAKTHHRTREQYHEYIRKKYLPIVKERVSIVLSSRIDFSKFGWVTKLSKELNMKTQKINGFMKTYMPDFLEKCYRRKTLVRS